MSLKSRLLRGDAKLEAAAVSDPAHITQGASGPHVEKIQLALITLDGATLDPDGVYGPSTAAAVLAYKKKRRIINPSYQQAADDIVGKMTMASLDQELVAMENRGPVRIRPLNPAGGPVSPSPSLDAVRGGPRLGFAISGGALAGVLPALAIDLDVQSLQEIRVPPRNTAIIEIVNGNSALVRGQNLAPSRGECKEKISWVFDPKEPGFIPAVRLNPEPQGPMTGGETDGNRLTVRGSPQILHVDSFRPGDAVISVTGGISFATLSVKVRGKKVGPVTGTPAPTRLLPGSKFFSDRGEPGIPGGISQGRPFNPRRGGRMINIGGVFETPEFEDYTASLAFSGANDAATKSKWVFRPWTEDPIDGVASGKASDICMRSTPVSQETIDAVRRMAAPGCRFSFFGDPKFVPVIKGAFGITPAEEASDRIVIEFP
jgi:peptidoglycan hydrolase-like protein with peptidoglycan-binding domain